MNEVKKSIERKKKKILFEKLKTEKKVFKNLRSFIFVLASHVFNRTVFLVKKYLERNLVTR